MSRLQGTVFATRGMAASLTFKQGEMLLMLTDAPKRTRELSDIAEHLLELDMAQGVRPLYYGVSDSAIYGTLTTLEQRRLVRRTPSDEWALTENGKEAADLVR